MENEVSFRLVLFVGLFLIFTLLEIILPRRIINIDRIRRWSSNLGLVVIDSSLLRLIFPAAAVGIAVYAQKHNLGLLHWLSIQGVIAGIIGFLLLDVAIYTHHIISPG